ncbi:MAG: tetratricopeptide repeat protein [Bacteroidota bacterium]
MRFLVVLFLICLPATPLFSQPNCLIYPESSGERLACELSYRAIEYPQGSKESQLLFDQAISIGPNFAWAYYEKSVPFFKRGFLLEGLEILKHAVDIAPLDFLCYRAYWFWQYKNYQLCIRDLETYYKMPKAYLQTTPGGEKDMRIILGLAYAKIGNFKKGIEVIENCLNSYTREIDIGFADYLSLGMLYYYNGDYDKAMDALLKQETIISGSAETEYFLGMVHKKRNELEEAEAYFQQALATFSNKNRFHNINAGFRVSIDDVKRELEGLTKVHRN